MIAIKKHVYMSLCSEVLHHQIRLISPYNNYVSLSIASEISLVEVIRRNVQDYELFHVARTFRLYGDLTVSHLTSEICFPAEGTTTVTTMRRPPNSSP